MTDASTAKPLLKASEIAAKEEVHIRHPWNPRSDIYLRQLSEAAGLKRVVVTLARVPPGKESFLYHSHERDEEFLYILSGRGRAEIGHEMFEVAAGDFMGFPAPGVAHHLTNPYEEDLVYLMAGERSGLEVGHFPKIGRKVIFSQSGAFAIEDANLKKMEFTDWLVKEPSA